MADQSSSVAAARRALGQRLREIRLDSGLTSRALAGMAGWHESKCSRLEHGRTSPSEADLRAWTVHCGVPELTADLIAAARGIDGMYVEWRRMERGGLRHAQESVLPLWERTRRFRTYSSWLIPGPVQTPAYIRALLTALRDRRRLVDDIDAAVEVRVAKQRVLYEPRQFAVLLEESALHVRIGGAETMSGQLRHLLTVASLPSLSLGIIPVEADRSGLWPLETFFMFDSGQVNVELVSAHLTVTQSHEVHMYEQTFAGLADLAVYGSAARRLITGAIATSG